ncbi:MAG: phage regulatory CII family protein [Prosthecobacter sp.]
MDSHDIISKAVERTSFKEVAAQMGVSLSLAYKWSQPDEQQGSGTANPLDRVRQLYEITKDPQIVHWLCQKANGFFVQNTSGGGPRGMELMPATQEIVQQFAALLAAISKAAADDRITSEEATHIRGVWDELKRFTEGFVRLCEKGDFTHLAEEIKSHQPRK